MAQGYERKDNRPKMCFKGNWTKVHHVEDLLLTFCPSVFLFYFWCSLFSWNSFSPFFFSFSCFASIFACLCFSFLYLHIPTSSRVSSVLFSWALELDCLWFWQDFFLYLPPVWRVILGQGYERNYQAQKKTTSG